MKPLLSRRRFCVSAAFSPLLAAAARSQTQPPADPNADLPAQTLHAMGARMLREGRTFEKAADRFRAAAQKEPGAPSHPIALGCALASRAVSIAYAAAFTQMLQSERAHFAQSLQEWERGRADFEKRKAEDPQAYAAMSYDDSKPKLPPLRDFVTKDDQIPFRSTPAQTATRLSALCREVRQAWEKGLTLCKTDEEKAQAFYTQAWGMRLLADNLGGFWESGNVNMGAVSPETDSASDDEKTTEPSPKRLAAVPAAVDAQKAIAEAVRLAPENPLYVQALGDLLMASDEEKAVSAYQKAAALAPKNANLSYLLYRKTLEKGLTIVNKAIFETYQKSGTQKTNAEPLVVPLGYLHQAQARDKANAWPRYEEAGILFRLAPYGMVGPSGNRDANPQQKRAALQSVSTGEARKRGRQAVDLMVTANGLPRYAVPVYENTLPDLLKAAWNFNVSTRMAQANFDGAARLRELARSTTGYAQVMVQYENNAAEAVRANRATVGMGFRLVGDWVVRTEDDIKAGKDDMDTLVGMAICAIGYKSLMQTYQSAGDKAGLDAATRENEAFQARAADYKKAVTAQAGKGFNVYEYY